MHRRASLAMPILGRSIIILIGKPANSFLEPFLSRSGYKSPGV